MMRKLLLVLWLASMSVGRPRPCFQDPRRKRAAPRERLRHGCDDYEPRHVERLYVLQRRPAPTAPPTPPPCLSPPSPVLSATPPPASNPIVPPYTRGVNHYADVLNHLTHSPAIQQYMDAPGEDNFVLEGLKDWAKDLQTKVFDMRTQFQDAATQADNRITLYNDYEIQLGLDSSRLDASITEQDGYLKCLESRFAGKTSDVALAEKNLADATSSLGSAESAVKAAEDKYNKVKNKCISGRRRKRETLLIRKKRGGFWRKVGRAIARPFEQVGQAVERGVCRGFGALTGRVRDVRRTRDSARSHRDSAQSRLRSKQTELSNLNSALQLAAQRSASARAGRSELETKRTALLASIKATNKVAVDLKAAAVFVGSLLTRGKVLSDAMEELVLLDVRVLEDAVMEVGALLGSEGGVHLPVLPTLSPQQLGQIRANLEAFKAALPNYPLVAA